MEQGATHYTHWFQPLTGSTAEKHDSFYGPTGDGNAIAEFSGKELIQGEPDASSFPTGGIRADVRGPRLHRVGPDLARRSSSRTRTARCSASRPRSRRGRGEALDNKIPLLRSMDALSTSARPRAAACSATTAAQRVFTTVGPEQEYFLIDEQYYFERPDLVTTGRTLFGAKPPKGHELDDHYFGSIPERVLACMLETEHELAKLGVPIKTRHNEVAPGAVRGRADLRELERRLRPPAADDADHAERRPPLRARLPAAREAVRRRQRLGQAQQLVDGHRHGHQPARAGRHAAREPRSSCSSARRSSRPSTSTRQLLRASVANAGQDHRLGANEAPPAIISIFLGAELEKVFDAIESGSGDAATPQAYLELGASVLPALPKHGGDRNRTSPFAFTGNKFEFRALGSSHVARRCPNTVLNTIVAEAIDDLADKLEGHDGGGSLEEAVLARRQGRLGRPTSGSSSTATTTPTSGTPRPRSAGWPTCARRPDALPWLIDERPSRSSRATTCSPSASCSRATRSFVEQYITTINIEARDGRRRSRARCCCRRRSQYMALLDDADGGAGVERLTKEIGGLVDEFVETIFALEEANAGHPETEDVLEAAKYVQ